MLLQFKGTGAPVPETHTHSVWWLGRTEVDEPTTDVAANRGRSFNSGS